MRARVGLWVDYFSDRHSRNIIMDIQDIRQHKAKAEAAIAHTLREFTAETTMKIDHVRIEPVSVIGAPAEYIVEIEAWL